MALWIKVSVKVSFHLVVVSSVPIYKNHAQGFNKRNRQVTSQRGINEKELTDTI